MGPPSKMFPVPWLNSPCMRSYERIPCECAHNVLWALASLELGVYNSLVGFCLGGNWCQQRQASHDLIYSTTPLEVSFPVRLCVCHLLLWTETLEAGRISAGCKRKVKNQPKTAPSPFTFTFLFIFLPDLLYQPQSAPLFVLRLMLPSFHASFQPLLIDLTLYSVLTSFSFCS